MKFNIYCTRQADPTKKLKLLESIQVGSSNANQKVLFVKIIYTNKAVLDVLFTVSYSTTRGRGMYDQV